MKNKFDLIIFDWDGTLINSIEWIVNCMQEASASCTFDIPADTAVKEVIGLSLKKAMSELFPGIDERAQARFIDCYSRLFFSKQIVKDDLFVGVFEMLVQLKTAGYQLTVATGKTRKGLQKALQGTGTAALFSTTRCADETASKPNPAMIYEIMQQLGMDNKRTLMVGDSVHDMQMAANAQIASVAVSCGANSVTQLQSYEPLYCLEQTTELLDLL
jgi:phosphoglycolate phosphatase